MTTASSRAPSDRPADFAAIRVSYQRFAGIRTRVLEVAAEEPAVRPATRGVLRRRRTGNPTPEPQRPRFVFLHGYCDSADTWRNVLRQFGEAGHSAVAVDLPGFGDADPLRPGHILPQLDAFVAATVKAQATHGPVVLVGNSLGGTVSLRAAQNTRLPVAGVTSIAAPGFSDTWLVRTIRKYPLPLRLYAALPLPVPGVIIRKVADTVIPRLLYATQRSRVDEDVQRFLTLFPDYRATKERLNQARQLVEELDDCYELDRVRSPLLVVACGKDRLVRAAGGQMLHTLVPHSRLLVREDWGHCPQLDHADEIAQLISYFGESCTRAERPQSPQQRTTTSQPDAAAG